MKARHHAAGAVLLTILLAGTACAGKTVVLESPPVAHSTATYTSDGSGSPTRDDSSPSSTDSDASTPSADPEPSESAPERSGWWPPEASPTPSETGSDGPSQSPSHEPVGKKGSEHEDSTEGKAPGPDRFTFPEWQEHIYDSRNGESPEQFRSRERFVSCGDFASEAGAHLISPDVAECLDEGKDGTGKESAIAVRTSEGNAHVWFVRVGPGGSEYFVDRSQDGGEWVHATCETGESIGVLACEEATALDGAQEGSDDPGESPTPEPEESLTPSETPEDSRAVVDEEPEEEDTP